MNYKRLMIILSLIAALILWAADSMLDAFFFHHAISPAVSLFGASSHEFYSLMLMLVGILLYSVLLTKMVFERDPAHEVLRQSMVVNDRLRKEIHDRVRTEGELRRSKNF